MDIHTLNAVLAKLQKQADHCHYMLRWALEDVEEDRRHMADLWSSSLAQANEAVKMVRELLEEELDSRAQEAA